MNAAEERLVYTCHECGAEFVVKRKPTVQKQNLQCAGGSELKKPYQSPVLRCFGTVVRECPTKW
jgi:hypothetical protein